MENVNVDDFPHIQQDQWEILKRMALVVGEAWVKAILTLPAEVQLQSIQQFVEQEKTTLHNAFMRGYFSQDKRKTESRPVKISVSPFSGMEGERILRWFVEVEQAMKAAQITDSESQVAFAMSKLSGQAKDWAFGKRFENEQFFPNYENFKEVMRRTYLPTNDEFRTRTQFLQVKQGSRELHEYAQEVRFLAASIIREPLQEATKINVFINGLNNSPIRREMFRRNPPTLEEAIEIAFQEEFSLKQSRYGTSKQNFYSPMNRKVDSRIDRMDCSSLNTIRKKKCYRCNREGHFSYECMAPAPVRRTAQRLKKSSQKNRERAALKASRIDSDTEDQKEGVQLGYSVFKNNSKLFFLKVKVEGIQKPLKGLIDSGASRNCFSEATLRSNPELLDKVSQDKKKPRLIVTLATGEKKEYPRKILSLNVDYDRHSSKEEFAVLEMDRDYDMIFGLPWLAKHDPKIDWKSKSISKVSRVERSTLNKLKCDEDVHHSELCDKNVITRRSPELVEDCDGDNITRGESNPVISLQEITETEAQDKTSELDINIQNQHKSMLNVIKVTTDGNVEDTTLVEDSPSDLLALPEMKINDLLKSLQSDEVEQICSIVVKNENDKDDNKNIIINNGNLQSKILNVNTSSVMDEEVKESTKIERFQTQGWKNLESSPFYELLREFEDVFPDEIPCQLPVDKGIKHEIKLIPGTHYCVTRQWPLPKEQVEAIDEFFAKRAKAGQVKESNSPHSAPTFCVKKATGGWRIVHAYNKLNDSTVPAQTPIPRKDMIIDSMSGSTIFSAIDLRDGYYQILMKESDIPKTAVSTPSGMLWEWLVMPQGLKNAPATFNRCVSTLFRHCRHFAPSYFDDIFVHSKAEEDLNDVEVHKRHLRQVLEIMRENKLYANLKKCVIGAREIPILGDYVGRNGVRVDPEKIQTISNWPEPKNVKQLRQWLGLTNYLHKFTKNYADLVKPLTELLKKDTPFEWTLE
jgi:hypothetical protein